MNDYRFNFLQALVRFAETHHLNHLFFLEVTITCLVLSLERKQDRRRVSSFSRVPRTMFNLYKMQQISQWHKLSKMSYLGLDCSVQMGAEFC